MARKIKTFTDFKRESIKWSAETEKYISEAADWDNASKRYIDKFFVSFDDKEKYEVWDFIERVSEILLEEGAGFSIDELEKVVWTCKDKIARNHPRRQLLKCVLAHYGIDIEDIEK